METKKPKIANSILYLAFLGLILILLYFMPRPNFSDAQVTFEISRDKKIELGLHSPKDELHGAGLQEDTLGDVGSDWEPLPFEENSTAQTDQEAQLEPTNLKGADMPKVERIEESNKTTTPLKSNPTEAPILQDQALTRAFAAIENNRAISDDEYLQQFNKLYYQSKTKDVKPESRKDVVIRYYTKASDGETIYSLRQMGFYIHDRPSSEEVSQLTSNALYYGSEVNLEDVKMVAIMLLRKGVPLKVVAPSQFSNDWKARSIEIGTDATKVDSPNLTLSNIRKLKF